MKRFSLIVAFVGLIAAAGYFHQHYEVLGLDQVVVRPRADVVDEPPAPASSATTARSTDVIRIATFNIQVFGESKLGKPQVMDVLADVVRNFDLVAIQEVRAKSQDVLPRFIERINAAGAQYDYVIGPRLGRTSSKEQYAYVFDRATIEVDRDWIYTVDDPDDLMHREPLAAAFRVRGPPPEAAFTFTLLNIHTDPDEVAQEVNVLDDVFRAVQTDGRGEDDVILLGDLNADDRQLGQLGELPDVMWVISGQATNTRRTKQYDNILFKRSPTVEFTGRSGVLDLELQYQLTRAEAIEVSDHLPVWAEFSTVEGAQPGRLAGGGGDPSRN